MADDKFIWDDPSYIKVIPRDRSLTIQELRKQGEHLTEAGRQILLAQSPQWQLDVEDLSELEDWLFAYWPYGNYSLSVHTLQQLAARMQDFLRTAPCARSMPVNIRVELAEQGWNIDLDPIHFGKQQPL